MATRTRTIAAVGAGYVGMALFLFSTMAMAFLALGADLALRPGTYRVSALWIAVSFLLGFGAAVIGGWTAAAVARNTRSHQILAVVVLLLGIAAWAAALQSAPPPAVRPDGLTSLDTMMQAQTPAWIAFLNPFVGAAGVWLGGRLRNRSSSNGGTRSSK